MTTINLNKTISDLFKANKNQVFEDSKESEFSRNLVAIIKEYGDEAVATIAYFIAYDPVNTVSDAVTAEALRWLGNINHVPSYQLRLWVLEQSLTCSKACIRDGAILGLSALNDPAAIGYIQSAIDQENCPELRKDMEQVLVQLIKQL